MDAQIVTRIKEFLKNNPQYKEYISGIVTNSNMIQMKNKQGKVANVTIDDLENNRLDLNEFDKEEAIYNYKTLSNGSKMRIVEAPLSLKPAVTEEIKDEEIEIMDFEPVPGIEKKYEKTLKDLKDAIDSKNINQLDSILMDNFRDSNTGLLNINNAVEKIINNCVNEAANCIRDNIVFKSDLSNYNIDGTIKEKNKVDGDVDKAEILKSSFKPVLVIIDAARLKGNVTYYNDDKKRELASQFQIRVEDKLRTITPPVQKDEKVKSEPQSDVKSFVLTPLTRKAAGFADIFILTIIILVYAAIIINLILKIR